MTVLVFGGSGQIGRYLLPLLAARDELVVALSRNPHPVMQGISWLTGNLPDKVPPVDGISAIFCFGPLQQLADWLDGAKLPHAPRVLPPVP
jgi:nucleoside-diphosphate-sugar epimerase